MYKKIYLCPNALVVDTKSKPPEMGNKTIGNNAVTAIGIASVIHHTEIHKTQANIAFAPSDNPSGWKKESVMANNRGPKIRPISFVLFMIVNIIYDNKVVINVFLFYE